LLCLCSNYGPGHEQKTWRTPSASAHNTIRQIDRAHHATREKVLRQSRYFFEAGVKRLKNQYPELQQRVSFFIIDDVLRLAIILRV
jgi:hypothetical protein